MARYSKYKTPADLAEDAASLGQPLPLSDDFRVLFQPLPIGRLTAGNRLVVHPMEGCDGALDGNPDALTYRRYDRFGAGGAKLIWGEAAAVCDEGRANTRQLLAADHTASGLEAMLNGCRTAHRNAVGDDGDLVIGLQLTHSGRYSVQRPLIAVHDKALDPLILDKRTGRRLDDSYPLLSDDDLKRLEDRYVAAALLVAKIGYDFVDLKQCHRYLLSELLAARTRSGPYGGSLENRTRLVRNVIGRIRNEAPRLVIATRMNAYDGVPYLKGVEDSRGVPCPHELPLETAFGTDLQRPDQEDLAEPRVLAGWLRDWGVSLISVTLGNPYANPHVTRPAEFPPIDGYHAPEHPLLGVMRHFRIARQIQAAAPEIPVVGSAYSWLQEFAAHAAAGNIAAGHVAAAGFGRATLSQPDFVRQLHEHGGFVRQRICRTFSYCTGLMRARNHPTGQYPTGCPPFDKEVYGPIWKELTNGQPPDGAPPQ